MHPVDTPILPGPDASAVEAVGRELDANSGCEVMTSPFDLGRYATDASHYQIMPQMVALPRSTDDLRAVVESAREHGVPVTGRGGGTSQNGQPINRGLVVDCSKHLNRITNLDVDARRCSVEPGVVLDHLNAELKPHGLWYPVDVSTASRATIGGMAGNNSCGARSIRYGTMRDNVEKLRVILADGGTAEWGELPEADRRLGEAALAGRGDLLGRLLHLGAANRKLIESRLPRLMRRVGGYNLDALIPDGAGGSGCRDGTPCNPSHLFIGSEGTLGLFERIDLKLSPLPRNKAMAVCHFRSFYEAMQAAGHIVPLGATAVELVDRTMIELGREIPLLAPTVDRFVKGEPEALLIVEFAEDDQAENLRRLDLLEEVMADAMGHPDSVVRALDPGFQREITAVRQQGLNIMMSMRGDAKPVSIVEDCAVDLADLAEYTRRLTEVFQRHGTSGTWYAHASVGCLHVRPVLNLKGELGAKTLRAVAEEAFALVREYKGSHSGEHGDGIARSEFHEEMFGGEMVALFGEVKAMLDPARLFNPNKIVDAPRHDDRRLFRYAPGYQDGVGKAARDTGFDWSAWGGLAGAVEMCNNNGACRKRDAGVMCPSYRATGNERDLVRGRANTLRLALSGQLGDNPMTSPEMLEAMKLCVGCKACRNECPTGVDMARMKTEVLYRVSKERGIGIRDRLVANLPLYAPYLSRAPWLANLRDRVPGLAWLSEKTLGLAAARPLPVWAGAYRPPPREASGGRPAAVLLGDTFNRHFEPENLYGARRVMDAMGYEAIEPRGARPLCCGRTFLAAGLVDRARAEAERLVGALLPLARRGIPVVGLEPSCLLTLRDEYPALLPGGEAEELAAASFMFEEFVEREIAEGRAELKLGPARGAKVLLHGHCHQKAAQAMPASPASILRWSSPRAAGWRAPSATSGRPRRNPRPWRNCRCCRPSAPRKAPASSPTGPAAATRSGTSPPAVPSMRRCSSPNICPRNPVRHECRRPPVRRKRGG